MGCSFSSKFRSSIDGLSEKVRAGQANKDLLDTIKFLRATPMFSVLRPREYPILAAACTRQHYRIREVVVHSGDVGTQLFVVRCGEASVWMDHPSSVFPSTSHSRVHAAARSSVRSAKSCSSVGTSLGLFNSEGTPAPGDERELWPEQTDTSRDRTVPVGRRSVGSTTAAPVRVGTLRSKDYFGEKALLWDEVWDVTVVSESDALELITISQDKFKKLRLDTKLRIPKRERIHIDASRDRGPGRGLASSDKPRTKSDEERAFIRDALGSRAALAMLVDDQQVLLETLVDVAWKQKLAEQQVIIQPQAKPRPCLFIVQEGSLRVSSVKEVADPIEPLSSRRMSSICLDMQERNTAELDDDGAILRRGGIYGEYSLMYEAAHSSKVQAAEESVVWAIDENDFTEATRLAADMKLERYAELLSPVALFSGLLSDEKIQITRTLTEQVLTCGAEIYKQGEVLQTFTILLEGEVAVIKDDKEVNRITVVEGDAGPVRHFGEASLTQPMHNTSTVRVISATAKTLSVSRESLEVLLGPIANLLTSQGDHLPVLRRKSVASASNSPMGSLRPGSVRMSMRTSGTYSQSLGHSWTTGESCEWAKRALKVQLDDLRKITVLGRGGFGVVELCEDSKTQALYALKTLKKFHIAKTDLMKTQVLNEKYILEMTSCRFIIRLHRTFKTSQELFFLMEPALGGELMAVYRSEKLFGQEVHARYYAASVICAFEHLHERFIIYRDLKPENLLLDSRGRLKLTDMGLAKFVVGQTYTICGTPVYFAPEVAKQSGYSSSVDWWQLGILVWELLTGRTPFPAQSRGEAFYWLFTEKVLEDLRAPQHQWPPKISEGAKEFLKAMLVYEASCRLPMLPNGPTLLRRNAWFDGFEWIELQEGRLEAPYQPPAWDPRSGRKTARFCTFGLVMQDEVYTDDGSGWDADF